MNKGGQSIVEFVLIATLVILGVVFMGPYLLRSIDAHFKLWDEGVHDSFTEVLTNAPVNSVPDLNITCTCQPDYSSGCGSSDVSLSQCGANQLNWNTHCNPQGCDGRPLSYCKQDDSCCTTYIAASCGNVPIPSGGLPTSGSAPCPPSGVTLPPGLTLPAGATCPSISTSTPFNCYYGQRIWATQCSDLPIVCIDDSTCNPSCSGGPIYPGSSADCDGPPYNGTLLSQTVPTTFVDEQSSSGCTSSTYACTSTADCNEGSTCSGGYCTCTYCTGGSCQQSCVSPYVLDHSTNNCEIQFYVAYVDVSATSPTNGCVTGPHNIPKPSGPLTVTTIGATTYTTSCTYNSGCDGGNSDCFVTRNDQSFQICAIGSTNITSAYIVSGGGAGKCGNTAGFTPGAKCDISLGF